MFYPIVLISFAPAYAVQTTKEIVENSVFALSEWISLLLTRGVYVVLAGLIAICYIITKVKKKLSECEVKEDDGLDELAGSSSLRLSLNEQSQYNIIAETSSTTDSAEIRLQETMETLKSELEIANKSKADLEITLAMMEKEKSSSQDHLIKMWKDAESETNFKILEGENFNREEQISENKEHENLAESLKNARNEIERLQNQSNEMKAERDMAIRLASDLMEKAKGLSHRDTEHRQLIEDMIDTELKRVREEDDENQHSEIDIKSLEQIENYCHISDNPPAEPFMKSSLFTNECKASECGTKCILHSDIRSLRMAVGDGPLTICNNLNDLFIAVRTSDNNDDPGTGSASSESSGVSLDEDGEEEKKNLVTRSPAFRAFLNSLAQRDSSLN